MTIRKPKNSVELPLADGSPEGLRIFVSEEDAELANITWKVDKDGNVVGRVRDKLRKLVRVVADRADPGLKPSTKVGRKSDTVWDYRRSNIQVG